MTAHIRTIDRRAHLIIGTVHVPLMNDDIGTLVARLNHIDLWEQKSIERAHRGDLRLTHALIRTIPGRIAVATSEARDHDQLDTTTLLDTIQGRDGNPDTRACIDCQTPFQIGTSTLRTRCTPCNVVAANQRRAEARAAERGGTIKTCPTCNGAFITHKASRKYCGPTCRAEASNERRRMNPSRRICPTCGEIFDAKPSSKKYCCGVCKDAFYRAQAKESA